MLGGAVKRPLRLVLKLQLVQNAAAQLLAGATPFKHMLKLKSSALAANTLLS